MNAVSIFIGDGMANPKMPSHRTTFMQSARIREVPKLHCKAIFKGVIVLLILFLVTLYESSSSKNAPGNFKLPGAFFDELDSDWGRGNATQAAQQARRGFVNCTSFDY